LISRLLRMFREFWSKIDLNHKLTIIFLGTFLVIGVLSIVYYSSKPALGPLYYGMDSESAAAVKEHLDDEKIPYDIKDGGKSIYIPKNEIYSVRLALAGKGLPKKGGVGYEIFDKTNLGMTEFVQKINYYRAIQGELARTISSVDGVVAARVHIVIPEESIFKEDQKDPSASIALQLNTQGILDSSQITGIRQLVASSVEGLKATNISIIDNWGNILSQPSSGDNTIGDIATSQIGIQKAVETHYVRKIESLLAGVLGNNNAVVRVNAALDFERIEKTSETYNPETAVVRSETITSETSKGETKGAEGPPGVQANIRGAEGAASALNQENSTSREVVNNVYEIDKTVQHIVEEVGDIKSLTASVFIRQKTVADEEGNVQPAPRAGEEMTAFEEIVKNALGFNEARGDRVSVKEIAFSTPEVSPMMEELKSAASKASMMGWVKVGGSIILVGMLIFFAFSLFKKVKVEEIAVGGGMTDAYADMDMPMTAENMTATAEGAPPAGVRGGGLIEGDVAKAVARQPEEASLIVKKWMSQ